jgi:hypothetical protein
MITKSVISNKTFMKDGFERDGVAYVKPGPFLYALGV